MEKLQFKTNVNCGGCIATVKPYLDGAAGIKDWKFDTTVKEKILTVESSGITPEQVIDTLKAAGYRAEIFNQ